MSHLSQGMGGLGVLVIISSAIVGAAVSVGILVIGSVLGVLLLGLGAAAEDDSGSLKRELSEIKRRLAELERTSPEPSPKTVSETSTK